MAFMKQAKTEEEIRKLTISNIRKAYNELAKDYNRLIEQDVILCPKCNSFKARSNFYQNKNYEAGFFPICKECLLKMATDKNKDGTYKDNKEKAKNTLRIMDLPFIESIYDKAIEDVNNAVNEKNRATAWQQWMVMLNSLPNWRGKSWKDSEFKNNNEFNDDILSSENQELIKRAKKRFGTGLYSDEEYLYLEQEYSDWVERYECDTKSQELIFQRICQKQLEINKTTKNGQPTKDLDDSLQKLLNSANILPKNNVNNSLTNSLTFGQLIEKWETEKPIPMPSKEFQDVDGIGKYIRVWFTGWLGKAVGLKNAYTDECEEYIKQYKVTKPNYNEEEDSESIYQKLFGKGDE